MSKNNVFGILCCVAVAVCSIVNGMVVEDVKMHTKSVTGEEQPSEILRECSTELDMYERAGALIRIESIDRGRHYGIQSKKYFSERVSPCSDNEIVWQRIMGGQASDLSILAVGFENIVTKWGDEGSEIYHDTVNCTRMAFLSGGLLGMERVSCEKYNHIYADFYTLNEDVPYMIDSHFFDYILVGTGTFIYMTRENTLTALYSMLNDKGSMILSLHKGDRLLKSLPSIFSDCNITVHFPLKDSDLSDENQHKTRFTSTNIPVIFDFVSCYGINNRNIVTVAESKKWFSELQSFHHFFKHFFNPNVFQQDGFAVIKTLISD
ncbi:MAG: hypothetical protein LBB12_02075 [Holosporaceae bacterium]|jgi:hypothetical protein|nr:hypothetical protein [Holosporaceae bacterium]